MPEFKAQDLYDALFAFDAGVNEGISPLLLQTNQLHKALNVTVRETFAHPRPYFRKMALSYAGNIQNSVEKPKFQGACYYKPDSGLESLMAAIAGRLFAFSVNGNNLTVYDVTGGAGGQSPVATQAWLWQTEKWVVFNDGVSLPIFWASIGGSARSNYGIPSSSSDTVATAFTIPIVNGTVNITLSNTGGVDASINVGTILTVQNAGQFLVTDISGSPTFATVNQNASSTGRTIGVGAAVSWPTSGTQLPPGRMGAYGMGRNWVCLVDGKQFLASDLVGGSSGTVANNYRDAVLQVTENIYLAGGGNFTVPGSVGDITFMAFTATLDTSLGQGPLQVGTAQGIFSCNAPVDRLTWQDLTNPILTESLIAFGGLSQNATVLANGDLIFRSEDGIRSLILARRDFGTWGNVPISREVDPELAKDQADLLTFGSAIVFDNRLLMTASPNGSDHGVYHRELVALNFDPISSLRGKAPAVYDGMWSGLNILQLVTGRFQNKQRAFAFTLNGFSDTLEVWEILKSADTAISDNDTDSPRPVTLSFESASLFNYPKNDPRFHMLKRLVDGEIYVDELRGKVHFEVLYKPDQWPCWVPWFQWDECSTNTGTSTKPAFRPTMGLGEPSSTPCDPYNNRILREGYTFQTKIIITGHCTFKGARFKAVTVPDIPFARPHCALICP